MDASSTNITVKTMNYIPKSGTEKVDKKQVASNNGGPTQISSDNSVLGGGVGDNLFQSLERAANQNSADEINALDKIANSIDNASTAKALPMRNTAYVDMNDQANAMTGTAGSEELNQKILDNSLTINEKLDNVASVSFEGFNDLAEV